MSEHTQALLLAHIAMARSLTDSDDAVKQLLPKLQLYIVLVLEAVPATELTDQIMVRQSVSFLQAGQTVEACVMKSFALYIYKMMDKGSGHPLEKGILRQQIVGVMGAFDKAHAKNLIDTQTYEEFEAMLVAIAEQNNLMQPSLNVLAEMYQEHAGN